MSLSYRTFFSLLCILDKDDLWSVNSSHLQGKITAGTYFENLMLFQCYNSIFFISIASSKLFLRWKMPQICLPLDYVAICSGRSVILGFYSMIKYGN